MKLKKNFVLCMVCLFTLINGVNVSAASTDSNCTITKPSVIRNAISGSEEFYDGSINTENIIEYISNSSKNYSTSSVIDVNQILSNSTKISILATGDVSATYTSPEMDTGTPGVTWGYVLNYVATPLSSGYGYKFKSVTNCTVTTYKDPIKLYTWADACTVKFNSATHSVASNGGSITIAIGLHFDVYYTLMGLPSTRSYDENHSNTVSMQNGSLPK